MADSCSVVCCEDEWKTHLKISESKNPPDPKEHVLDIAEPIKIFMFDMPKASYTKKIFATGVYTASHFVIGCVCASVFMYAFNSGPHCGNKYSKLAKKLHFPMEAVGILFHASIGILSLSQYCDSSTVLKWVDRRVQHEKQMLFSLFFVVTDFIFVFFLHDTETVIVDMRNPHAICPCAPVMVKPSPICECPGCARDYASTHFLAGLGMVGAYGTAAVTGILLYVFVRQAGAKGIRGKDSLIADVHTLSGIAAYMFALLCFTTSFTYDEFGKWIEENFGSYYTMMMWFLVLYLFLVSVIAPGIRGQKRLKTMLEHGKIARDIRERLAMENIEKERDVIRLRKLNEKKEELATIQASIKRKLSKKKKAGKKLGTKKTKPRG